MKLLSENQLNHIYGGTGSSSIVGDGNGGGCTDIPIFIGIAL